MIKKYKKKSFYIISIVLFFATINTVFAAIKTNNWIFNTPVNYTYDLAKIDVTGGEALLNGSNLEINDDTEAEFNFGTYNLSHFKTDHLELDINKVEANANTLVLYHLDGNTGVVVDSSSNGNDATLHGATQGVVGKVENAISMDGTDDYLEIPADLGNPDAMTIEFWFKKPNINSGADYLLDGRNNGNWWFLQDYRTGANCPDSNGNICFNGLVQIPSSMLSNNTWYHVALTTDTNSSKIYLNGDLVDTGAAFNPNLGADVHIGTRFSNTGYFEGSIDELSIWDKALDANTISQHAKVGYHSSGEFSSPIFDAGQNTDWQQIDWVEDLKSLTNWLNVDGSKRKNIKIDNSGNSTALSDYQVELNIVYDSNMNSDFSDLRFTSSDGITELNYWIESSVPSTSAIVWVKAPSIPALGSSDIYMYYGNPSATSNSNGEDTFLLFDDFDDDSIDTSKWLEIDIPINEITEANNKLAFTRTTNGSWNKAIIAKNSFSRGNLSFEADYKWTANNPQYDAIMFGWHDSGTAASYSNLIYAYYNPGSGSGNTVNVSVYEDGHSRSGETGSWTFDTDYKIRVRTRDTGGAYYEKSTDGGETWVNNYSSSYSTESDLKPAWAFYSGTHRYDNVRVRQWTNPEPSSSYGSEEGQTPTDLRFQIRSCDDANCDGEIFIGPDGTNTSYFSNPAGESLNVSDNRYFQYLAYLTNSNIEYSPDLFSVTIDYLSYPTDKFPIQPASSFVPNRVEEWSSFIEDAIKPAGTEIYYQLSDDDGISWKYWDGAAWSLAAATNYNSAATISSNISSFPYSNGQILFKAFLAGNGAQTPRLNNIRIDYEGNANTVNCVNDWTFDNAGDYTYDSSLLEFENSVTKLSKLVFNFLDDTQAKFDLGTYFKTAFNVDHIELTSNEKSGTYISSIKDTGSILDWKNIEWKPFRPYGKELPNNKQIETDYSYGNGDMTNNLLLMHLNESSGSIADSSGNANNAVNNGAVSAVGEFANSLYFGGDGDIVESSSYTYSFSDELTLSAWFKYNGPGNGSPRILEISKNGNANSHALAPDSDGSLRAWAQCDDGRRVGSVDDSTIYDDGKWHHMVYTYKSPNSVLYVDGVQTDTGSGFCNNLDDGSELAIGAISDISGNYSHNQHAFDGYIDEISVWDKALSSTEVLNHYLRGAMNVKFQVRSCDDDACVGESFIGPDGSSGTYYSEINNDSVDLPQFVFTNLAQNRYFQYRANLTTEDDTYSPKFYDVSIDANGDNYSDTAPSVYPKNSFSQTFLHSLTGFKESSTKNANTEIYYNLSNNDGLSWLWWNGKNWTDVENGLASDSKTIALWHFTKATGLVLDSANNNNGINKGATRAVAGRFGTAFDFDGIDDYVDIHYSFPLGLINTDFTIDFWIKTSDSNGVLLKKYTGSVGGDAWGVRLSNGIIEFYDGTTWISSGIQANTGDWKHIAIIGDNSSNIIEFFEDGKSVSTSSFNDITANSQNLLIASDLSTNYFDGSLDEIRISNTVRSDAEIFVSTKLFNIASDISSNIDSFVINGTNILFKAFLKSDGLNQVSLDNLRLLCTYSVNDAAVATIPTNIIQTTDGSGKLSFKTTISDINYDDTKMMVEYSDDGGTNWYDAEISSASVSNGTADVDNSSSYQIGTVDAIDTSTGAVTLTVVWDTKSASNENGSLNNMDLSNIQVRVTPNDFLSDGGTSTSVSFELDNLSPSGLSNLALSGSSANSLSFTFNPVDIENNFNHYEIWYSTDQAKVENRTANEWDNRNDVNLATMIRNSTVITGLNSSSKYFTKIWAVDDFGNEITTVASSGTTTSLARKSSGGGGGGHSHFKNTTNTKTKEDKKKSCLEYNEFRDRTFVDLPNDHWGKSYLNFLKNIYLPSQDIYILSGYTTNYNSGGNTAEVGPDKEILRYELVKMILLANCITINDDISSGTVEFSDLSRKLEAISSNDSNEDIANIKAKNFIKKVMYTALDEGIINGYEDGTVKPWQSVNRAEAMKIILNAAKIDDFDSDLSKSVFTDVSAEAWFSKYVLYAYKKGIVKGYNGETNYFHPENTMTRAQAVKVITLTMPFANIASDIDTKIQEILNESGK